MRPSQLLPSPAFKARVLELVRIAEITAPRLRPMRERSSKPSTCKNGHEGEMSQRRTRGTTEWRCKACHREAAKRRRDDIQKTTRAADDP